jgi:hypothetical protein
MSYSLRVSSLLHCQQINSIHQAHPQHASTKRPHPPKTDKPAKDDSQAVKKAKTSAQSKQNVSAPSSKPKKVPQPIQASIQSSSQQQVKSPPKQHMQPEASQPSAQLPGAMPGPPKQSPTQSSATFVKPVPVPRPNMQTGMSSNTQFILQGKQPGPRTFSHTQQLQQIQQLAFQKQQLAMAQHGHVLPVGQIRTHQQVLKTSVPQAQAQGPMQGQLQGQTQVAARSTNGAPQSSTSVGQQPLPVAKIGTVKFSTQSPFNIGQHTFTHAALSSAASPRVAISSPVVLRSPEQSPSAASSSASSQVQSTARQGQVQGPPQSKTQGVTQKKITNPVELV